MENLALFCYNFVVKHTVDLKGEKLMQIINPLNRVPDTEETMVRSCACWCSKDSADKKVEGVKRSNHCACQCNRGPENEMANWDNALDKA